MKLSDLTMDGAHVGELVFGVEVDQPSFVPPAGLKRIGVLLPLQGDGIDEIDVVISYGMAGVETTMEIPAEKQDVDPAYLVSTAANIGASLALLPPVDASDRDAVEAWIVRVCDFASAYLGSSIYGKDLFPVTSFLEYMFAEAVSDVSGYAPKDEYLIARFASVLSEADSDAMKARLRALVYEHFGSKEDFEEFVHLMANRIYSSIENGVRQFMKESGDSAGQAGGDVEQA